MSAHGRLKALLQQSGFAMMVLCAPAVLTSCTCCKKAPPPEVRVLHDNQQPIPENKVPGTETQVWREPMYDQVTVPGQIDPSNTYYRAKHTTFYEIRHDRFQLEQFPPDQERDTQDRKVLQGR